MANYGTLEAYDPQEEWSQYIEQLQFYFEANAVSEEDKQRAILLSVCGSKTYQLIRNLTMPGKPSDMKFTAGRPSTTTSTPKAFGDSSTIQV